MKKLKTVLILALLAMLIVTGHDSIITTLDLPYEA